MANPTIEIIEHPLSPYAQKLKIALNEKQIPYSVRTPDAIGSGNTGAEFQKMSPRGEVPVFIIDGRSLFDSSIILEFIEERFPEPALLPSDPFARAEARTIEEVCDTHYEAINWGLSEINNFKRAQGELAERMIGGAGEQISRLNTWLEGKLGSQNYFGGDRIGWGDVSAVPFVQGSSGFGFGPADGSPLGDWLARCRQHPSIAPVFKAAKDAVVAMASVAKIVEAGQFKRQYRDHRLEWMIRTGGFEVVQKGLEADNIRFNSEPV